MQSELPFCGIDSLLEDEDLLRQLLTKKIGVVTNQCMLTQSYKPVIYALLEQLGTAIKCLLTPEHGWSGFIGEGVSIKKECNSRFSVPVLSLYGGETETLEWIRQNNIDFLLIDLQDIGLRCYTYATTCAKLLEFCLNLSIEVIVCDRPNPLGPQHKGPGLNPNYRSIVGYFDVPFQHGQTMGQLLSTFIQTLGDRGLSFRVLPSQPFHQPYTYPWIPPSPNLPSWDAVLLYPALVLLEGTNVSEGRGTTLPFTSFGALGMDNQAMVDFINAIDRSGVRARPITFTPQSGKLAGQECQGVQIFIIDYLQMDSFTLGIEILCFLRERYEGFEWMLTKKNSYFIDYLLGTDCVRLAIERRISSSQILSSLSKLNFISKE